MPPTRGLVHQHQRQKMTLLSDDGGSDLRLTTSILCLKKSKPTKHERHYSTHLSQRSHGLQWAIKHNPESTEICGRIVIGE
jgi:hypothetical protein